MKHKKYGLLEDGTIEHLWYDDKEMRDIREEKEKYYLFHDRFIFDEKGNLRRIDYCKHQIIKEADSVEDLK